jgi:UDPglucose--hexose-1-phosphate uridylyltransferase
LNLFLGGEAYLGLPAMDQAFSDAPHRRYNPLLDEWVLVSPHRAKRPWQGAVEAVGAARQPYDPKCYLCPGNTRASGDANPSYSDTFVFVNDFSALLPSGAGGAWEDGLLSAQGVEGECRVICFSPRHDLTLPDMEVDEILKVVEVWVDQTRELGQRYDWVQVFENKGEAMGCSNPHPHGQIWASSQVPSLVAREARTQEAYLGLHGAKLLAAYRDQEMAAGTRVVLENDHWVWLVPFWATWPYEVLLLPKGDAARLTDLSAGARAGLAAILREGLQVYDRLFSCSFPYSMGWHGAPFLTGNSEAWLVHAHFYPPLLRSATVKKFMVGYEMLAESQRDITPEQAAERLRGLV